MAGDLSDVGGFKWSACKPLIKSGEHGAMLDSSKILDYARQHRPSLSREGLGQWPADQATSAYVLVDEDLHGLIKDPPPNLSVDCCFCTTCSPTELARWTDDFALLREDVYANYPCDGSERRAGRSRNRRPTR